jgi:hypothetical protein
MRHLERSWKNKPYDFTRRVRFFAGEDFRLNVEDECYSLNLYFDDRKDALATMRSFREMAEAFAEGDSPVKAVAQAVGQWERAA